VGVQQEARRGFEGLVYGLRLPKGGGLGAIKTVADDRVTDGAEMNTKLVGATGLGLQFEKGGGAPPFADPPTGAARTTRGVHHRAGSTGLPAERQVDTARIHGESAANPGEIRFLNLALAKLGHQRSGGLGAEGE
jgi:hypothetical protein